MNNMEEIINTITQENFGTKPAEIVAIVDKGKNNEVFRVLAGRDFYILRMNNPQKNNSFKKIADFEKEKKCSDLARGIDLKTPKIIKVGESNGWAYSFQEYVEGINGVDFQGDIKHIWNTLGQYVKNIHQVPADEVFIGYQERIQSLFESNFFISREIFSDELSRNIKDRLEETYKWKFSPVLTHGELNPRNVVIDNSQDVWLIDWETGRGDISPTADLAEIYTWKNGKENIQSFLDGYGLDSEKIKSLMRNIQTLILLRKVQVTKRMVPINGDWKDNKYIIDSINELGSIDDFDKDILFTRNL